MNRRQLLRFAATASAAGLVLPAERALFLARDPVSIIKPEANSILAFARELGVYMTPWQAKYLSQLKPGDIVRFSCGSAWREVRVGEL